MFNSNKYYWAAIIQGEGKWSTELVLMTPIECGQRTVLQNDI